MTPKEANKEVENALRKAQEATDIFLVVQQQRDDALAYLTIAREVLEDVLRKATGLDEYPDRKEEYLRLYTFKR